MLALNRLSASGSAQPRKCFHKFRVLCMWLNEAKRQKHLTDIFAISVPDSTWLKLRYSSFFLSVMQYIFPFTKDSLSVTRVAQLFLFIRLKYHEAKIQMSHRWKPVLLRYIKIKRLLFLQAYNTTRSVRSKANNLTNPIKSGKCRQLVRKPYCIPFAIHKR